MHILVIYCDFCPKLTCIGYRKISPNYIKNTQVMIV